MRPRIILLVFIVQFFANFCCAETLRLPASRDLWISSAEGEEQGNNGGAASLKLKGYQEFSIVDFDLSEVKDREIRTATLHVKLSGKETLKRVGVSTLASPWIEGTGQNYQRQSGSSSFRWRQNPDTPWVLGNDYSDITQVMFDEGGTFWSHADATTPNAENWQSINIDPKIIAARTIGLSYGFVLFDDTGTELYRDGENVTFNNFPNRFFYSKDQNAASAPYLVLELEDVDISATAPPKPQRVSQKPDDILPSGEAVLRWTMPPLDENEYLGFFVSINENEMPRYMIPCPDFLCRKTDQEFTMHLRDLDLKPGAKITATIRSVNSLGIPSDAMILRTSVSDFKPLQALPGRSPGTVLLNENKYVLPKLGDAVVSVIDELDKVTSHGDLVPKRDKAYFASNHIWNSHKKRIFLQSAGHEFTAFQIHLHGSCEKVRASIQWNEPDDAPKVEFFRFEYVDTPIGPMPDPMLPMGTIHVKDRETIYVEVFVPKNTPAKTHRGVIRLESENASLDLNLDLMVRDFSLPNTLSFLPEMNCYSLPENEREYYRLAQLHRTYLNRVPYSHRGTIARGCAPNWDEASRTFDWKDWDRRYGPYFDGSAFADLPRGAVPVEAFYLPLFENFPADIFKHYRNEHRTGNDWIETAFPKEYDETFQDGCRGFAEHIKERKWNDTCFHFFLNNKVDYKRPGWNHGSSPWLLDEPAAYSDFMALAYFGRLFHEAVDPIGHHIRFRCDISRPQWQRNSLDGLIGVNILGGDVFHRYNRMVSDRAKRNDEILYTYGTTCRPEEGSLQPVAWCLDAWTLGADGVIPWQTVGTLESWKKSDELALFYPGRDTAESVAPSHRLKAYRRGQQDVEYLVLLKKKLNRPRWDISQAVRKELDLSFDNRADNSEDAGTLRFSDCRAEDFHRLRTLIGQYLDTTP